MSSYNRRGCFGSEDPLDDIFVNGILAANPSEPLLISYFYNDDYYNISTLSTTYTIHLTKSANIITNPSELTRRIYHNHDIFYDGDDGGELFPDEVKRIQQILERTSFDAITPDFPITDSPSMGDEHLSTIPEMKLDELIKSSVENLVPIPSESEDSFDIGNISIVSSPKFDSLLKEFFGELAPIDLISPEIDEADFDPKEEIRLVEKLFDSLMEEIDIFLAPDDLIPPGIKNDDYDSEGDILFLEEFLSNDPLSLPENESFHFDRYYVTSSPPPPEKPPDDDHVYFDIEPDTVVFTKVVDDISDNSTRELYVHVPKVLTTLPTLSPMFDTLLPFSSENDEKVFKHGILASNEEKSPHLISHWGFKAFQVISDFSESPMMIYREDIPILDVLLLHFYPP
ncbi:hypothetical protein Tco_0216954 [Tanacetum coccineum]